MSLGVDTSLVDLMTETRKRATKVKNYGVALNLVLTPSPRVVKHLGELGEDAKDDRLLVAVEEAATRAMARRPKTVMIKPRAR